MSGENPFPLATCNVTLMIPRLEVAQGLVFTGCRIGWTFVSRRIASNVVPDWRYCNHGVCNGEPESGNQGGKHLHLHGQPGNTEGVELL